MAASTTWSGALQTEFGQLAERRLRNEPVIWLVTVGPMGRRSRALSGSTGTATRC